MQKPAARTIAIGVAILLAALSLGYWGYSELRVRNLHQAVEKLVDGTSARLRETLATGIAALPGDSAELPEALERPAAQIEADLARLRAFGASPDRALVLAADQYIDDALRVLRAVALTHRRNQALRGSHAALVGHMQDARRRSDTWIEAAIGLKKRYEADYLGFEIAAGALHTLLESLSESRAKLARHLGRETLVAEGTIAGARQGLAAMLEQTAAERAKTRQLAPR